MSDATKSSAETPIRHLKTTPLPPSYAKAVGKPELSARIIYSTGLSVFPESDGISCTPRSLDGHQRCASDSQLDSMVYHKTPQSHRKIGHGRRIECVRRWYHTIPKPPGENSRGRRKARREAERLLRELAPVADEDIGSQNPDDLSESPDISDLSKRLRAQHVTTPPPGVDLSFALNFEPDSTTVALRTLPRQHSVLYETPPTNQASISKKSPRLRAEAQVFEPRMRSGSVSTVATLSTLSSSPTSSPDSISSYGSVSLRPIRPPSPLADKQYRTGLAIMSKDRRQHLMAIKARQESSARQKDELPADYESVGRTSLDRLPPFVFPEDYSFGAASSFDHCTISPPPAPAPQLRRLSSRPMHTIIQSTTPGEAPLLQLPGNPNDFFGLFGHDDSPSCRLPSFSTHEPQAPLPSVPILDLQAEKPAAVAPSTQLYPHRPQSLIQRAAGIFLPVSLDPSMNPEKERKPSVEGTVRRFSEA